MALSAMTQDIQHKNKKSPNVNSEPITMQQTELKTDKNMKLYLCKFR
jgi:hypothetical protein